MSSETGAPVGRAPITKFLAILLYLFVGGGTIVAGMTLKWQLDVATEHGVGVDAMINFLNLGVGALFVVGHLVALALILKGRGEGEAYRPVGKKAEFWSTILPVIVIGLIAEGGVIIIGMPVFAQVYGEHEQEYQVEMTAKQFEWISRLPGKDGKFGRTNVKLINDADNPLGLDEDDPAATDDIITRGAAYLPRDRWVKVRIRSLDVLHSFAVPVFRTKQDAVPGMPTTARFKATKSGKFEIACAELCGLGHYRMKGWVNILEPAAFQKWFDEQVGWFE